MCRVPDYPHHKQVTLRNFTVFKQATFDFVPGVNVLIGENGTGKTHLMKAIYAAQRPPSPGISVVPAALINLFLVDHPNQLIRREEEARSPLWAEGVYDDGKWSYRVSRDVQELGEEPTRPAFSRPVFIPATEMIGHSRGFLEAYDELYLEFDLTFRDLVRMLRLKRRAGRRETTGADAEAGDVTFYGGGDADGAGFGDGSGDGSGSGPGAGTGDGSGYGEPATQELVQLVGGAVQAVDSGRFYLETPGQRMPMSLVAEGLRKIATLVRLEENGWLQPGATLLWDEPEANLNPIIMRQAVAAVLELARRGVQVFLATQSYVILKELDLQTGGEDSIRFFSLTSARTGTAVSTADKLSSLQPNSILDEFASLYDRDLTRATGRSRTGAQVR